MAGYNCFNCKREVKSDITRKKIRCPYCGSKMLIKPTSVATKVPAI